MEYFTNVLYDNKKIDDDIKSILVQINDNLKNASMKMNLHITAWNTANFGRNKENLQNKL